MRRQAAIEPFVMALQSTTIPHLRGDSTVLPSTVLENLAARFRPGGLFLMVLRQDGTVVYHDAGAGVFFERYLLPLLKTPDKSGKAPREKIEALEPGGAVAVWQLPGVSPAPFPHVEQRQASAVIVLGAKSSTFGLSEDVLRACGKLGLVGLWLHKQAEVLPAYGEEAIQKQGRLLAGTLRDQVRLSGLENELNSLSGQLANTYEELSLIYQVSSGMKINRRASDFFAQACLDLLEVMNVRGMGVVLNVEISNRPEPALYGQLKLPQMKVGRLAEQLSAMLSELKGPLLVDNLAADPSFQWL